MACANCGKSTFLFSWKCTNWACKYVWCNDCAKGWLFRSCPRCGNRCS